MTQQPFHIFECLRALNSIMFSPVRDFLAYDNILRINDMFFGRYGNFQPKTEWPYWLQIKRPGFDEFPHMPKELIDWVADWGGQMPNNPPKMKRYARGSSEIWQENQVDFVSSSMSSFVGERFDNDRDRVTLWREWLRDEWLPWANDNLQKNNAIEIYENLLLIDQKLIKNENKYEFLWCTATLFWRIDSLEIRHPLLTQKIELEYLPDEGIFNIVTTTLPPKLEYSIFLGLTELDIEGLFELEEELSRNPIDIRDIDAVEAFCHKIIAVLGDDCQISYDDNISANSVEQQPIIYINDPIIFLKPLDSGIWRGELENIVENINNGAKVNEIFSDFYRNVKKDEDSIERNWKETIKTPAFPWECENTHFEILRKIADRSLSVVQTPVGSDKTKLIANLLVHFLANGKRVLVTGGSNEHLRQISTFMHKEFSEVAPLCVSSAASDRENVRELFASLSTHNRKMNFSTRDDLGRELAEYQKVLGQFKNDFIEEKVQLTAARELEYARKLTVSGKELLPWQVAKWIVDSKEKLDYIPDDIGYDASIPLNTAQLDRFFELIMKVALDEGESLSLWRPNSSSLMDAGDLLDLFVELDDLCLKEESNIKLLSGCALDENITSELIRGILAEYQQALADFPGVEGDWLDTVIKDVTSNRAKQWEELYNSTLSRLQKLLSIQKIFNDYKITLPEEMDVRQVRDSLFKVRVEFHKNNKLGVIFKLTTNKKTLEIYKECLINDLPATSVKEIDTILAKIDYLDEIKKIVVKWNNTVTDAHGPLLEIHEQGFNDTVEKYCVQIKQVFNWRKKHLDALRESSKSFMQKDSAQYGDRNWLIASLPKIQAWIQQKKIEELRALLRRQHDLVTCRGEDKPLNPICSEFAEALGGKDIKAWGNNLAQLKMLEERFEHWGELIELYKKLFDKVPLFAEKMIERSREKIVTAPKYWEQAWRYAQAKTWLNRHIAGNKLDNIFKNYEEKKLGFVEAIKKFAEVSSWYWQLRRVTTEEKRALDFLLSKSQMQFSDKYNDEDSYALLREAEFWRMSLPVWIMPINMVLSLTSSFDKPFDVVIVIDGEKEDIFALPIFLRGKKVVVLGDNMLPSESMTSQGRAAANLLLGKSLLGLPNKLKFEINASLYDYAFKMAEEQSAFLAERSMEPLGVGAFINKYFYDEKMLLLPQSYLNKDALPSVQRVFIEPKSSGHLNKNEVDVLFKRLKSILKMQEYIGKTIAIVTLGGAEQQELLDEKMFLSLPEEEIFKRKIVCSSLNNYTAGKRDIVFLSLVSARTVETADIKKINAALSFAKEQIIVIQPFSFDDISARNLFNPLLTLAEGYSHEEMKPEKKFELYSTDDIVKDVWTMIVDKGYKASPEYSVSNLSGRIDILIEDDNNKVAIICDGLRTQKELEEITGLEEQITRVKWHFWHLRSALFYLDKEAALKDLWELLDKLDIRTIK